MKHLSGKDKKQLVQLLPKGYSLDKKDEIIQKDHFLIKDKEPWLLIIDNNYFPHLKSVPKEYPKITVDDGAVKFVLNGADIMRPGITSIDEGIEEGDIVLINNVNVAKPLALGIAQLNSKDMQDQEKGKSVKIYHYVGDEYYS